MVKGLKEIICGVGFLGISALGIYGQGVYGSRYGDYYGTTYARMKEIDGEISKFNRELAYVSIENFVSNEGKLDKIGMLVSEKKEILGDPKTAGEVSEAEKKVREDEYKFTGCFLLLIAGGCVGLNFMDLGLKKRRGQA